MSGEKIIAKMVDGSSGVIRGIRFNNCKKCGSLAKVELGLVVVVGCSANCGVDNFQANHLILVSRSWNRVN